MEANAPTECRWLLSRSWRRFTFIFGLLIIYLTIIKMIFLVYESFQGFAHCPGQSPLSDEGAFHQTLSDAAWTIPAIVSNAFYFFYIVRLRKIGRVAIHLSWFFAALTLISAVYWYSVGTCDLMAEVQSRTTDEWTNFWHRGIASTLFFVFQILQALQPSFARWLLLHAYAVHAYALLILPWLGIVIGQIGIVLACRHAATPASFERTG